MLFRFQCEKLHSLLAWESQWESGQGCWEQLGKWAALQAGPPWMGYRSGRCAAELTVQHLCSDGARDLGSAETRHGGCSEK